MTNQLIGVLLYKGFGGSGGDPFSFAYTHWMPVRSDVATFGVEVIAAFSATLTWNVETRTAEDPSTVTTVFTTSPTASAIGSTALTATLSVSGAGQGNRALQLYRYRFSTGSTASTSNWIHFRPLPPSWVLDR